MLTEYYQAARQTAALAEKDWSGIIKLTGSERASWLQGMVTNDVQKLAPGTGCYAAHLTPQGKIVAQMHVLVDEDALWLTLERAAIPKLIGAFDKLLIMEDVQIKDSSDEYDILGIVGPKAKSVLESWLGERLHLDGRYGHLIFEGRRVFVSDIGYDVWVSRGQADKMLRSLAASGATAIDRGTWDVLRTEAGIPVYGVDIDETTTLPEMKSPIYKSGKEVGYVTTSLLSPGLNKPISLGFVSRSAYAPGTAVEIVSGQKPLPATIVDLPFVRGK